MVLAGRKQSDSAQWSVMLNKFLNSLFWDYSNLCYIETNLAYESRNQVGAFDENSERLEVSCNCTVKFVMSSSKTSNDIVDLLLYIGNLCS